MKNTSGRFIRKPTQYRNKVSAGGGKFPAAAGRYHLYVSYACPWASRCLAFRALKGLEEAIPVHTVAPIWGPALIQGEEPMTSWVFSSEKIGGLDCSDPLFNADSLRQLYLINDPDFGGRPTVPVLWDSETKSIVNNESSEIIRMLNKEFNEYAKYPDVDLAPPSLLEEIEEANTWMYETINNGVYKAGFATTQEAYEDAFTVLFDTLDDAEIRLSKRRFLCGNELTEADIRLFVTLVRFDPVYVLHFKCNKKRLVDYPNLFGYTRDVYQYADGAIANTVNMEHIKAHYFGSHKSINPYSIIPLGPDIDYSLPTDRPSLFQ
eukprot:CAMPEP_0174250160 /NCGR_PEP_ID=MMETSP0439-20130205/418_1 /TAXON_ID=0 /ORGANISM="Stereomyxa ramosa, Strain Chinc5" /LENGTH=320 /DNA_ID=CAMNT_0015330155 /DNA_START=46 /DNA_END=1008 /DNA_ORIENTATION=-